MKTAFISYKTIDSFYTKNGWYTNGDNYALVLQGSATSRGISRTEEWEEKIEVLLPLLTELDGIVVYLGLDSDISLKMVAFLRQSSFPAEKVTFVSCDCEQGKKMEMINDAGYASAGIIFNAGSCELGRREVRNLLDKHLNIQRPRFSDQEVGN